MCFNLIFLHEKQMSLSKLIQELLKEPIAELGPDIDAGMVAHGERVRMYVERFQHILQIPPDSQTNDLFIIRIIVGALFGPGLTGNLILPPDIQRRRFLDPTKEHVSSLLYDLYTCNKTNEEKGREVAASRQNMLFLVYPETKPPDKYDTILRIILDLQALFTVRLHGLVVQIDPTIRLGIIPQGRWAAKGINASVMAAFNRTKIERIRTRLAYTPYSYLPYVGFMLVYEMMSNGEQPILTSDGNHKVVDSLQQAVKFLYEALIEFEKVRYQLQAISLESTSLPDKSDIERHIELYSTLINQASYANDLKKLQDLRKKHDDEIAADPDEESQRQKFELEKRRKELALATFSKRENLLKFEAYARLVRYEGIGLYNIESTDIVKSKEKTMMEGSKKGFAYSLLNYDGVLISFLKTWIRELDYADNAILLDRPEGIPDECTLFMTLARSEPAALTLLRQSIKQDLHRFLGKHRAQNLTWLNSRHVREAAGQVMVTRNMKPLPPKPTVAAGGGGGPTQAPSLPRSRQVVYPRKPDELTGLEGLADMMEFLNSDACLKVTVPTDWHESLSFQSSECIDVLTRMRTALDKEVLSLTPHDLYDQTDMVTIESLTEFVTDTGEATPEDRDQRRRFLAALIQDIYEFTRTMKCHTLSILNVDDRHFKILHWYAVLVGEERGPISDLYPYLTTIHNSTFLVVKEGDNSYNDADHDMTELCQQSYRAMKTWEEDKLFPAIHFDGGDYVGFLQHLSGAPQLYQHASKELIGAFVRRLDYYKKRCTKLNDDYHVYIVHKEILDLANLLYATMLATA